MQQHSGLGETYARQPGHLKMSFISPSGLGKLLRALASVLTLLTWVQLPLHWDIRSGGWNTHSVAQVDEF